jgi:regulator of sigma E protease
VSTDILPTLFSNIWSIFLVVLFFVGSIFVHELGHFFAARRRGLHVSRFSIGFGPKIFSWQGKDGVEYRVSWLPLGGYVALPQLADMRGIEGESDVDAARLPPISYTSKLIVFAAGAAFNVLFAFLLATVIWVIGQPQSNYYVSTRIGYVAPSIELTDGRNVPAPALQAGLRIGDTVRAIDGHRVHDWNEVMQTLTTGSGRTADGRPQAIFTIERGGQTSDVVIYPQLSGEDDFRRIGISPDYELIVHDVPADSIGAQAGFITGDEIVDFDGQPMRNQLTYQDYLVANHLQSVVAHVKRNGQLLTLTIPPRPNVVSKPHLGLTTTTGFQLVHPSPYSQIRDIVVMTFQTFSALINPHSDIGLSKMTGAVGIVHIFYDAAEAGIRAILWFTILINMNLAIFNLLPIPVLDGGHILFATIGRLRGRALPMNFIMTTQSVFMVLLLSMMLYLSIFDVRRWSRDVKADRAAEATAEAAVQPAK